MKKKQYNLKDLDNVLESMNQILRESVEDGNPKNPVHPDMAWLLDRDLRLKTLEFYPKCFLPIKKGRLIPFIPICNRSGMVDKDTVDFSLKLANRLKNFRDIDKDHLLDVISQLQVLSTKYEN